MMRYNNVAAAVLLCLVNATPLFAQSGPAETPPSSFTGQQYVDSRGCVFLRAGYGGQVQWVQRISQTRQPLCGYPPTFGAVTIEMADETVAPQQEDVTAKTRAAKQPAVQQPAGQTVARLPRPGVQPTGMVQTAVVQTGVVPQIAAPVVAQQTVAQQTVAQQTVARGAGNGPQPGQIGCYTSAPVPMVVQLTNGGTALVCTKGDGTMNGWRSPVFPAGTAPGAALNFPRVAGYKMTTSGQVMPAAAVTAAVAPAQVIPKGFKAASNVSRLNPLRGVGTLAGQAQQDQIWTREVPAQEVASAHPAKVATKVSTSGNPTAATAAGSLYVAVGTFGVAANAAGAVATLQAMGLPAAKSQMTKGGQALQVVYAGPFASAQAAQAALTAARGAGFNDAFIR